MAADILDRATQEAELHLNVAIQAARGVQEPVTSGTCKSCLNEAENLINKTCVPCRQRIEDNNFRLYGTITGSFK